jgi:hypothetical protein
MSKTKSPSVIETTNAVMSAWENKYGPIYRYDACYAQVLAAVIQARAVDRLTAQVARLTDATEAVAAK